MRATEIPIASPCGANWRTMKPTDTKRFCELCKKHVHDLSAMTAGEARALLAAPPTEGLCVRYLYDAHGDVVFRGTSIPAGMLVRAKRAATAAAALALPMTLAACSSPMNEAPGQMRTMGAVACPMPTPSASASASASAIQPVMGEPPLAPTEKK